MARKAWDALSDSYRSRLLRSGIDADAHSSGESLASARGHTSERSERFRRETDRFSREFVNYTPDAEFSSKYGLTERSDVQRKIRDNVRSMGEGRGREYMKQARQAAKRYERGDYESARSFWLQRPDSRPEYMYFYHGIFGF